MHVAPGVLLESPTLCLTTCTALRAASFTGNREPASLVVSSCREEGDSSREKPPGATPNNTLSPQVAAGFCLELVKGLYLTDPPLRGLS